MIWYQEQMKEKFVQKLIEFSIPSNIYMSKHFNLSYEKSNVVDIQNYE